MKGHTKKALGYPKMVLLIAMVLFGYSSVFAQSFGQNKPRYKSFDFSIQSSDHFDIYHYLKNDIVLDDITRKSEQWYEMHRAILGDTFAKKNPLVLYNNHPDFQQTNTISGSIGVGTGGVTEAFKNRVVFPLAFTNEQTNHVLGHEMVHAFQYNIILGGDSTNLQSLANLPLWMVEGLAEYMSKGKVDPFTSMWMRSSILNDDIPSFRDLQNPKYFPYRYGQVFWAYIAGNYGDEIIRPLFMNTAKFGLESAIFRTLGIKQRDLEQKWAKALEGRFTPYMAGKDKNEGSTILSDENSGKMNVSPSLSPNGKYITYWSEKNLLETNLYMANARTGKVIREISNDKGDGHLDAINFLEASGTWSKDSKKFAFVGLKKGRNVIIIKDVESGKTLQTLAPKGVEAFTHLAWNPADKDIVFTGLVEGQVDLYKIDLKTKKVTQLTNDPYAEIMANFNEDGSQMSFSTDENAMRKGRKYGHYSFDIAIMDMANNRVDILDIFPGADNVNPNWDHEGNLVFLSNRDGFRNAYKYYPSSQKLEQITDLQTGISGITDLAPALTVSTRRDRIIFSVFNDFEYSINKTAYKDLDPIEVDPQAVDFSAGTLVASNNSVTDAVNKNLLNQDAILESQSNTTMVDRKYKPKFKLDFVGGGAGVAVGTGNGTFGNQSGLAGGIQLLFSDQLGNNQIFSNVSLNGEIFDIGGQVSYLNRKHRIAYGVGISHIPLQTGFSSPPTPVTLQDGNGNMFPGIEQNLNIIRVYNDAVNVFAHLPFSKYLRLEGGISAGYQFFRWDEYQNIYVQNQFGNLQLLEQNREKLDIEEDVIRVDNYYSIERGFESSINFGLVGDNSVFGMTSPLAGHRFRLGIEQHFGINNYTGFLADARKYFWLKPISLGVRALAFNRIDHSDGNNIYPLFIGQQGFVRGYGGAFSNFSDIEQRLSANNISFGQLIGSNTALISTEARLPFFGPRGLAIIPSNMFFSDLVAFYDMGVAYNRFSDFGETRKPYVTMSAGLSARVNLFNAIIVEPYYAFLFKEEQFSFGINLVPGW